MTYQAVRPEPRLALAHDLPPATAARRLSAGLLDLALLLALGGWLVILGLVLAEPRMIAVGGAGLVMVSVVQWVLHGRAGWTLGRRAVGIRTLDVESRRPIGVLRVLLRGLVVAAGSLAAVVGLLVVLASPAFDRTGRRRGWHDLAAGDEVLDVRAARGPVPAAAVPPRRQQEVAPPRPERRAVSVPDWALAELPPTTGQNAVVPGGARSGLVLAPLSPQRSGPDLDTRAMPVVRQVGLSYGLAPELEMTRPAGPRDDLVQPVDPVPVDSAAAEIELADGRRITVARTALVGRNPASDADVQLVRVIDPGRSVSKTHLQIGVEPGGVWVADRGSTNGTVVTLPDGAQVVCQVDQQVRLRAGSTVSFGDCSLRLVRAPGRNG
ncbi:RDD family protein [Cellulomonas fengjieae]|uniref:RDD family protein n=1 Tax=Cellulomonas fengjieae TaxID=2819978 RepID=UPI001AAF2D17|nr:RDD family protein [Cellulomonas fengjieae]MBO3101236.1 RDD family protein [Cellulomonas fengjieae]